MSRTSDAVIAALQALLAGAVPSMRIERNTDGPEHIPAEGLVIVRDGFAGPPTYTLSPLTYHYVHAVRVEIHIAGSTQVERRQKLSEVYFAMNEAIEANRSLGGLCDWLSPAEEPPEPIDYYSEGSESGLLAELDIEASYSSRSPLL